MRIWQVSIRWGPHPRSPPSRLANEDLVLIPMGTKIVPVLAPIAGITCLNGFFCHLISLTNNKVAPTFELLHAKAKPQPLPLFH